MIEHSGTCIGWGASFLSRTVLISASNRYCVFTDANKFKEKYTGHFIRYTILVLGRGIPLPPEHPEFLVS